MPRPKTIPDDVLLSAALDIVHRDGPAALTFGALAQSVDLAASTIVQRFGTKADLLRAALLHAWNELERATVAATAATSTDAPGVVDLLVRLSGQYDPADAAADHYADQLMVLREDLRDPVLRARGEAWFGSLAEIIESRLADIPGAAAGLGALVLAQWQGALIVWGFTRAAPVPVVVRTSLDALLQRLGAPV